MQIKETKFKIKCVKPKNILLSGIDVEIIADGKKVLEMYVLPDGSTSVYSCGGMIFNSDRFNVSEYKSHGEKYIDVEIKK